MPSCYLSENLREIKKQRTPIPNRGRHEWTIYSFGILLTCPKSTIQNCQCTAFHWKVETMREINDKKTHIIYMLIMLFVPLFLRCLPCGIYNSGSIKNLRY